MHVRVQHPACKGRAASPRGPENSRQVWPLQTHPPPRRVAPVWGLTATCPHLTPLPRTRSRLLRCQQDPITIPFAGSSKTGTVPAWRHTVSVSMFPFLQTSGRGASLCSWFAHNIFKSPIWKTSGSDDHEFVTLFNLGEGRGVNMAFLYT